MVGMFSNKKKEKSAEEIAQELFNQILAARDESKAGGVIDEKVFNDRLNHMFSAG